MTEERWIYNKLGERKPDRKRKLKNGQEEGKDKEKKMEKQKLGP